MALLELSDVGIEFPTPKGPFCALQKVNLKIEKDGLEISLKISTSLNIILKIGPRGESTTIHKNMF